MKRTLQTLLILAVAIAAGAAGYWTSRRTAPAGSEEPVHAGASAETLLALALPDIDGTPQALAQWRDRVLVVNFWATWCPPCRKEIPDFVAVSEQFSGAPVQFVGISIDSADKVREFAREHRVSYPLLIGSAQTLKLAGEFGNSAQALPFTVILDRQGMIRRVKLGTLNEAELQRTIRALLDG